MTRKLPGQTPRPLPTPLAMSTAPLPQATALPHDQSAEKREKESSGDKEEDKPAKSAETQSRPYPPVPELPCCKVLLECRDLRHDASSVFFSNCNPAIGLSDAVKHVLECLYQPSRTNDHIPPTRSVTLVLRSMEGVAYTIGTELDSDHKEIHFSLDYIGDVAKNNQSSPERIRQEISGVLVHEMVHAWQWNGHDSAPGGLIEGIADFVRLRAGLAPPHWNPEEVPGKWDEGYQHTAYFLEWLEQKYGAGSVRRINGRMQHEKYEEDVFWKALFGESIESLWQAYKQSFEKHKQSSEGSDGHLTGKELQQTTKEESNEHHSMEESAFWHYITEQRGLEESIVLKACWRTRRHLHQPLDTTSTNDSDGLDAQLVHLWHQYLQHCSGTSSSDIQSG